MEYLLILTAFLISGVFFEWKYGVKLYDSWKKRLIIPFFFLVIGLLWDYTAVYNNHWSFPGEGLVGLKIGLLPVEEYLFMLIVPYWIVVFHQILSRKL